RINSSACHPYRKSHLPLADALRSYCCLLLPRGFSKSFVKNKKTGRGGGDRNCIPPLLSLTDRARYRPLPKPIVRTVRKQTTLSANVASFAGRLHFAYCEEGMRNESGKALNLGRHKRYSKICSHEKREEMEQDLVAWKSPIAIAEEYGLADRMNVY